MQPVPLFDVLSNCRHPAISRIDIKPEQDARYDILFLKSVRRKRTNFFEIEINSFQSKI
jgi:hypothetical protein